MPRTTNVLGYEILDEPAKEIAARLCDALQNNDPRNQSFVFMNPHSVVIAERDRSFKAAINGASGVFCDGAGLSMAARLLNHRRVTRTYGFKFFTEVSSELSRRKLGRVFFLGGQTKTLERIFARYRLEYPGIAALGSYSPPYKPVFSDADIEDMARQVRSFDPDVIWIGLGSPKQEVTMARLAPLCNVRCIAAIGAVFDFYAGNVKPAPAPIRRFGLEWLYRLLQEPRRLWKRTFVSAPLFVIHVFRAFLFRSS